MESITPLASLLQRVDSIVVVQHATATSLVEFSALRSVATDPPTKVVTQLTNEIGNMFCDRLMQQFPVLATTARTVADACAQEPLITNARAWVAAEVSADGAPSAAASPMEPASTRTFPTTAMTTTNVKASRIRRRALPRDMSPSMIAKEFSFNVFDMVLVMLQHAGRCLPTALTTPATSGEESQGGPTEPDTSSTMPPSQTDNDDEVIFLDDIDAAMERFGESGAISALPTSAYESGDASTRYCTPAPPLPNKAPGFPDAPLLQAKRRMAATTSKRRREEAGDPTLNELILDVKRLLKRQDQLLAGLSTQIFANADLAASLRVHSVALCLSAPVLRLLWATLHALETELPSKYQRLREVVMEAAEEMKGFHDTDIVANVGMSSSGVRSTQPMQMTRAMSACCEDSSSRALAGSSAQQSRSTSPLQHLLPLAEDSQSTSSSTAMRGSTSGYTIDGDRFSIPPPLQRTVSDVVRRGAPPPLDKSRLSPVGANHATLASLQPNAGHVSPPRSPLLGMSASSSFGISPLGQSSSSGMPFPRTVTRQTGAGSRTPCTVPKRTSDIPSYMLMKRKPPVLQRDARTHSGSASNAPSAPSGCPPMVALSGSPDCSISLPPPPPMLSLDFTGSSGKGQVRHDVLPHGREDRILFADDDDD